MSTIFQEARIQLAKEIVNDASLKCKYKNILLFVLCNNFSCDLELIKENFKLDKTRLSYFINDNTIKGYLKVVWCHNGTRLVKFVDHKCKITVPTPYYIKNPPDVILDDSVLKKQYDYLSNELGYVTKNGNLLDQNGLVSEEYLTNAVGCVTKIGNQEKTNLTNVTKNGNLLDQNTQQSNFLHLPSSCNHDDDSTKKNAYKGTYIYKYKNKNIKQKSLEGFSLNRNEFVGPEKKEQETLKEQHHRKMRNFKQAFDEILKTSNKLSEDVVRFAASVVYDSGDNRQMYDYIIGQLKSNLNKSEAQMNFCENIIMAVDLVWEKTLDWYRCGVRQYVDRMVNPISEDEMCRIQIDYYFKQFPLIVEMGFSGLNTAAGLIQDMTGIEILSYPQLSYLALIFTAYYVDYNQDSTLALQAEKKIADKPIELDDKQWLDVFRIFSRMYETFCSADEHQEDN